MAENQPKRRGRPAKAPDAAPATDVAPESSEAAVAIPASSESVSDAKVEKARKKVAFESIEHYLKYLSEEKSK